MAAANGAVLLAGASAGAGSTVQAFLQASGLSLSAVQFRCLDSGNNQASEQRYQAALLLGDATAAPTRATLAAAARLLASGAQLFLASPQTEDLQKDLLLSGYTDVKQAAGAQLLVAQRPAWEVGAKAALSLKRPAQASTQQAAAPPAAPPAASAWKISGGDEDELLDDEQLLTEEDRARPAAPAVSASDCSTSKKACANCSCGRAEREAAGEKVVLTQEMLDNPQTNCGSCSLGDAFRCAGCPYRGLPAFEPGKKITLGSAFLTADA